MASAAWRLERSEGLTLVRCAALFAVPGIVHAFSTRLGRDGVDFDLGPAGPAGEPFVSRRAAFLRAAGLGEAAAFLPRQTHGREIVEAAVADELPPEADGVFLRLGAGRPPSLPAVRSADCVPVLIAERSGAAVAAIHGGWRGTAAGITSCAVRRFAAFGMRAEALVVAMGPAIRGCCYEVGDEVVAALSAAGGAPAGERGPTGRTTVDLPSVHRAQLIAAGVPENSIHDAPWCTRCRADLFFSARAEGPRAGRMMAVIGPRRALTPSGR